MLLFRDPGKCMVSMSSTTEDACQGEDEQGRCESFGPLGEQEAPPRNTTAQKRPVSSSTAQIESTTINYSSRWLCLLSILSDTAPLRAYGTALKDRN